MQWTRAAVPAGRAALALLLVLTVVLTACATPGGAHGGGTRPPRPAPTPEAVIPSEPVPGGYAGPGMIKGALEGEARSLTGAGATFPAPLYSKWFSEYEKATGVRVNYQSIGSGGGIKGVSDGTVDFGGTDAFMTEEQLQAASGGNILHIPAALGAVVPTYNIPGLAQPLKLTAATLSGIFLGEITTWNDPRIMADNPGADLPNRDIITIHRSDGSGTTAIFVDYLATVNPTWASKVGRGTSVKWPNGLGAKGNEGVAGEIKAIEYSIGYIELIYALQNELGAAHVQNKAGNFIAPSLEAVTAAAAGAAASLPEDLRFSIVDAPGEQAWPISGLTWLLAYENQTDAAKATALTRMLWWAVYDGQGYSRGLGYAPLPGIIQARAAQKVLDIKVDGRQAFPGR